MRAVALLVAIASSIACRFSDVEERMGKSFPLEGALRLLLTTPTGSLYVRSGGRHQVDVELIVRGSASTRADLVELVRGVSIDGVVDGDWLRVDVGLPGGRDATAVWRGRGFGLVRRAAQVEIHVTVPERFAVRLETSGGSVSVDGVAGDVAVRTTGGSLSFRRIGGGIVGLTDGGSIAVREGRGGARLRTSGGSIQVDELTGDLDARTSGGSIAAGRVTGRAVLHTSRGSITVRHAGAGIEASTTTGSIRASFAGAPAGPSHLTTSRGSITVTLPRDVGVDLEVVSRRGSVTLDPPVRVSGTGGAPIRTAVHGGGPPLRLTTSTGSVVLRRSGRQRAPRRPSS